MRLAQRTRTSLTPCFASPSTPLTVPQWGVGKRGKVRNPPAWHRVLPGPSGPEPQKSPRRVRKGVPGPLAPGSRRVPKECAPESEKSPKTQLRTFFGLFWPWGTLSDSFRTLCQAGGFPRERQDLSKNEKDQRGQVGGWDGWR